MTARHAAIHARVGSRTQDLAGQRFLCGDFLTPPLIYGLTLWQPWASLVALGHKPHETRPRRFGFRGRVLIHAARRWDRALIGEAMIANATLAEHGRGPIPTPPPLGAVVAIARIAGCRPTDGPGCYDPADALDRAFGNWSPGRFAYRLEDVRPLREPVPWKGAQGPWIAPEALVERCEDIDP